MMLSPRLAPNAKGDAANLKQVSELIDKQFV